ncbi:hypothetical protein F0M16_16095 [Vibrio cholerae]|uniref:Uncharacterized protein n=1 Tax=Vibrio cholerae TaxID=666 RepID=A0A5Q6PFX0_VIBCL|nr:hypothetical protein [Vibrio cholerae]KAA1253610.1 hypothetical protein F0M16_16095 [Vibrio cholerae]
MNDIQIYKAISDAIGKVMIEDVNELIKKSRFKKSKDVLAGTSAICIRTERVLAKIAVCLVDLKSNKTDLNDISLKDMFMQLGALENSVNNGIHSHSKVLIDAVKHLPDEAVSDFSKLQLIKIHKALDRFIDSDSDSVQAKFARQIKEQIENFSHQNFKELYKLIELKNEIFGYNSSYSEDSDVRIREADEYKRKGEVLTQIKHHMINPRSVFFNNLSDHLKVHNEWMEPAVDRMDLPKTKLNHVILNKFSCDNIDPSFLIKNVPSLTKLSGFCSESKKDLDNLISLFVGNDYSTCYGKVEGFLGEIPNEMRGKACTAFEDYTKAAVIHSICLQPSELKSQLTKLSQKFIKEVSEFTVFDEVILAKLKAFEDSIVSKRARYFTEKTSESTLVM